MVLLLQIACYELLLQVDSVSFVKQIFYTKMYPLKNTEHHDLTLKFCFQAGLQPFQRSQGSLQRHSVNVNSQKGFW